MAILDIQQRIAASRSDFMVHVWPIVSSAFPRGSIVPVEAESTELTRILDIAGIDHVFRPAEGEPYGISQRVLHGSWETLTLRPLELERLRAVWRPGAFAPVLIIQGYVNAQVDGQKHLDAAVVLKTEALLKYTLDHPGSERCGSEGQKFRFWTYDELEEADILAFRAPTTTLKDPLGLSRRVPPGVMSTDGKAQATAPVAAAH